MSTISFSKKYRVHSSQASEFKTNLAISSGRTVSERAAASRRIQENNRKKEEGLAKLVIRLKK